MIKLVKIVRFNYRLAGEDFCRVATLQEYGTVHRPEPQPDAGGAVQVSVRVGVYPNEQLVNVPLAADEFVS
jgi:hypothetical protein